jgi:hypothetical protein
MLSHYGRLILPRQIVRLNSQSAFKKFMNSDAGPKTIFFWGPIAKWGLVLANIGDMARPAENLSVPQCLSLGFSCCIWCRWTLIIIPKNYLLFAVNFFIATTSIYQLGRIVKYRKSNNLGLLSGEPLALPATSGKS